MPTHFGPRFSARAWQAGAFVAAILWLMQCSPLASAAVVEVQSGGADFRFFLPEGPRPLRGVITSFNGSGADFRAQSDDPAMQAVASSWRFAFVATRGFGGSGAGLATQLNDALLKVGTQANHLELKNAPLLLTGYSLGGGAVCAITEAIPQRVLGFIAMRGGGNAGTLSEQAQQVPGLFVVGSGDGGSNPRVWDIFRQWRFERKAPVAFAVEWVARHVPVPSEDGMAWPLTWAFAHEVIRLRYPADRAPTPDMAPALNAIPATSVWHSVPPPWDGSSVDLRFPVIGPASSFTAVPAAQANWHPSEEAAIYHRAFNTREKLSVNVPRNVSLRFASPATKAGSQLTRVQGSRLDVELEARMLDGLSQVEVFLGAKALGVLKQPPWKFGLKDLGPGIHAISAIGRKGEASFPSYETFLVEGESTFGSGLGEFVSTNEESADAMGGASGAPDAGEMAGGNTQTPAPEGRGGADGGEEVPGDNDDSAASPPQPRSTNGCALGGAGATASGCFDFVILGLALCFLSHKNKGRKQA